MDIKGWIKRIFKWTLRDRLNGHYGGGLNRFHCIRSHSPVLYWLLKQLLKKTRGRFVVLLSTVVTKTLHKSMCMHGSLNSFLQDSRCVSLPQTYFGFGTLLMVSSSPSTFFSKVSRASVSQAVVSSFVWRLNTLSFISKYILRRAPSFRPPSRQAQQQWTHDVGTYIHSSTAQQGGMCSLGHKIWETTDALHPLFKWAGVYSPTLLFRFRTPKSNVRQEHGRPTFGFPCSLSLQ